MLIVNLRPSTLRKWGLEYESLAAANPGWSWCTSPGTARGGPKSDWPGFGTLGEAMSGFAHLTGTPTARRPCRRSCSRTAWPR